MLETDDYEGVKIIKGFSEKTCEGRRYAVLEGGYDHRVLGGRGFHRGGPSNIMVSWRAHAC